MFKNNSFIVKIVSLFLISLIFSIMLLCFCGTFKSLYGVFSLILLIALIYLATILIKKYKKNIPIIFLIIAIPISLLYTFFLSPYRIMDESAHIIKNIEMSKGNFISKKDSKNQALVYTPIKINDDTWKVGASYKTLIHNLKIETDYSAKNYVRPFWTYTVINMPTAYASSGLGFTIGRLLNLNIYVSMYIAKVFNVITFLIIGYVILKLLPSMKLFALVYLLNPMNLQAVSSVGADCFTNLICLLFIAYIINLKFKDNISNKDCWYLFIIMLLLSTAKFVYFPLFILLLLIFKKLNKKQKRIILFGVLGSLILTMISVYIGLGYKNVFVEKYVGKDVDPLLQMKYVLTKPWKFVFACFMSLYKYMESYFTKFFGQYLGNYDIKILFTPFVLYLFVFFSSIFTEKRIKFEKREIIISLATVFILFCCIFGVEYLTWTRLYQNIVEGVQGRYFIPFMLLPLIFMNNDKIKVTFKNNNLITICLLFFIHILNILVIIKTNL